MNIGVLPVAHRPIEENLSKVVQVGNMLSGMSRCLVIKGDEALLRSPPGLPQVALQRLRRPECVDVKDDSIVIVQRPFNHNKRIDEQFASIHRAAIACEESFSCC